MQTSYPGVRITNFSAKGAEMIDHKCQHEHTIDIGDEEHGVIACTDCESVLTRKLLREQEEEK